MVHILCAGEALIDSIHHAGGRTDHVGGSLLNVALGIARQGGDTTLTSAWGPDDHGRLIESTLRNGGVTIPSANACLEATNIAHARLDSEGKARYTFDLVNTIPPVPVAGMSHLHIGSLGAFLEPGREVSVDLARQAHASGASVSYDINARPTLMGDSADARLVVEENIRHSTIVKASDEDVAWLWPGESIENVARSWLTAGATLAIITLGGSGTLVLGRDWLNPMTAAPRQVTVVDTVGAGDSFMAGFLVDMARRNNLGAITSQPEAIMPAIEHAMITAGITVTHAGAYAPTRDEVLGFR